MVDRSVRRVIGMAGLAISVLFGSAGCSSEITDEDLKIWTNNEEGFRQMASIMTNPEVTQEQRVKGLYFLVKANHPEQVSRILYNIPEPESLAQDLRDKLLPELEGELEEAVRVKDGLFSVVSFLPKEEQDAINKGLADWAFQGLNENSTTEQVKTQVEHRIGISGVERLGKHGVAGATLLISRGFAVTKLFELAIENKPTPEQADGLLDALIAYEALPEVSLTSSHIARYREVGTLRAGAHLMGIYQSLPAEDRDLKLDAFNGAESIFSALPEGTDKGAMANSVRPLMKSSDPDDRWYAITTLLKLEGEKVLDTAWDSLMDDGVYTNGLIDPLKSIVDFCREGIEPLGKNAVDKTLKMVKSGNRVQRAAALICLKAQETPLPRKTAKKLSRSKDSLGFLLGKGVTVSSLVQNTQDGVELIRKERKLAGDDKEKLKAFESMKFFAVATVDKTGDALSVEAKSRAKEGE